MIDYRYDDGGRTASGHADERNDCVIRAFSNFFDMSYADAHKLAATEFQRRPRGYTKNFKWINWMLNRGIRHIVPERRMKVSTFLQQHPEHLNGTIMIRVSKHVFVVKDGVILDIADVRNRYVKLAFVK